MIRILVVDDQHVVRAGVIALLSLEEDFEIVGEAADGLPAVDQFRLRQPDVTIIDLRLPELSGSEVMTPLRRISKLARFVVLTAHFGEGDIFRAVDAGAHSYILKGSTHNELIDAIRLVHEGNSHFPENVAAAIARRGEVKPLSHGRPLSLEKSCRGCQIPLSVGPAM